MILGVVRENLAEFERAYFSTNWKLPEQVQFSISVATHILIIEMMSHTLLVTTIFFMWSSLTAAFHHRSLGVRKYHTRTAVSLSDTEVDEITFNSVVVSGFISKENDFAEAFVFSKLHKTGRWKDITAITDNIKYARKRMMSPGLVYSGLTDILKFAEIDKSDNSLEMTLDGKDAWLNFNVTAADVPALAEIAVKVGLKRVVFAVRVSPEESGEGVTFDTAVATLSAASIAYTIIKYGTVRKMGEAIFPYKIVRGDLSLPSVGDNLSSDDLMRVSGLLILLVQ